MRLLASARSLTRSGALAVLALALAASMACADAPPADAPPAEAKPKPAPKAKPTATTKAPAAAPDVKTAAPAGDEHAVLETDVGNIVIDLFEDQTPGHAENFKKLVRQGYYDGSPFHRVIDGFMAQGGGKWGPSGGVTDVGYTIPAELHPDTLPHLRGSLAAARTNNPAKASSGSQFYICFAPQPMLDQMGYTVFGKVVSGMDAVDKITHGDQARNGSVDPAKATVIRRAYLEPASKAAPAPAAAKPEAIKPDGAKY